MVVLCKPLSGGRPELPLEELPVGLPEATQHPIAQLLMRVVQEVYQQHLARGEGIDLVHQRCLERAAERCGEQAEAPLSAQLQGQTAGAGSAPETGPNQPRQAAAR